MAITLQAITRDNLRSCVDLRTTDEQQSFVALNMASLAQAYVEPTFIPRAIYADDTLVGFIMYGRDTETGADWIIRLMVDAQHQRKGYARAATEAVLALLKQQPDAKEVLLSFVPENHAAEQLYTGLGFEPTGEIGHGQIVLRLPLT